MESIVDALAVAALLGSGLVAGIFFAFSSFVMRALLRRPPAEGRAAMQAINVAVLNRSFLGAFVATALVSLALVVLAALRWDRAESLWYAVGGALYVGGTFLVTGLGNVPLNDALARVEPEHEGADEAWLSYASRWTQLNHVRTAAALLACLCFALGLREV